MKNSMNRRNYNNNRFVSNKARNYKITRQNIFVAVAMAAMNFGVQAFSFLRNLVTVGCNPFEGLNRGQLRQMYWLQYVVR